jgi:hypothetical protein
MSKRYPDPPWQMHGRGLFVPCVVRAADLDLPGGLEPVEKLGRTLGVLAYIEYVPPSPLAYHELIWMPAWVRGRAESAGERGRRMAQYVARMYVDNEDTLEAGRVIWKLPKTLATFDDRGSSVRVEADDGTRIALSFRPMGPRVPLSSRMSTLQAPPGELVRFRAVFRAETRAATYSIDEVSSDHPAWKSFSNARPLPRMAAYFESFESIMKPPEVLL